MLDRSLAGLLTILNRSFAEARLIAGLPTHHERIALNEFIAELKASAELASLATSGTMISRLVLRRMTLLVLRRVSCRLTVSIVSPR